MTCQAQMGLLVLRTCGDPSVGFCGECGKAICAAHQVGTSCPECAAADPDAAQDANAREAASRQSYYQQYGQAPQFGDRGFFGGGAGTAALLGAGALGFGASAYGAQRLQQQKNLGDYDPMET